MYLLAVVKIVFFPFITVRVKQHLSRDIFIASKNKCIGDDMKATIRQSRNCIKNQK